MLLLPSQESSLLVSSVPGELFQICSQPRAGGLLPLWPTRVPAGLSSTRNPRAGGLPPVLATRVPAGCFPVSFKLGIGVIPCGRLFLPFVGRLFCWLRTTVNCSNGITSTGPCSKVLVGEWGFETSVHFGLFWGIFGKVWPILGCFWPIWAYFGVFLTNSGLFWGVFGQFWPILGCF